MAIASYCEESLIVLLFVKSEIWKFFRHKSNKTVKFFMAGRSHRTEHLPSYWFCQSGKSVSLFINKTFCCLLTRIWLNSIFDWRVHTFLCILSLYSRYFGTASLLKIENSEESSGNILHIDSILSGK